MQDVGNAGGSVPNKREAFFAGFAARAKATVAEAAAPGDRPAAIMLTGGLRSRTGMAAAILDGTTDIVGLARPAAVRPHLPLLLLDPYKADDNARCPPYRVRGTEIYKALVPIKVAAAGFRWDPVCSSFMMLK